AGCGASWPTCEGVVIPELEGATAVEFTHRAASGIALLLLAWLIIRVFRTNARGAPVRKAAVLSGVGIISESLIGAVIVIFEWVENDASLARAISVPIHLVNTLVLLAGLTLVVYWVDRNRIVELDRPVSRPIFGFAIGMLLIAATGAVTALADTLFPAESLIEGLTEDFSATSSWLTRLRVLHPVVAILVGVGAARWVRANVWDVKGPGGTAARVVVGVVFTELVVGVINVWTLTPIPVQLVHLFVADVFWIAWVWLGAELLTDEARSEALVE
ncbi:MAG: COX15/CtaA family protein, partial [Acidimicrobiia bacterium]|nr:COX15/CtaA family protein [Acidimicrobiia bacterium]